LLTDLREWTGDQLRQLGSLARGLDIDDILSTSKEAFEDAVGVWGKQFNMDIDNLKALATQAKKVKKIVMELSLTGDCLQQSQKRLSERKDIKMYLNSCFLCQVSAMGGDESLIVKIFFLVHGQR
jgi:hypothetical protein